LLTLAPAVSDGARLQVSLSKNVNSRCTAGPFISGTEHGASLCCASLPVPSTLYGLSVRRLIRFDLWLPSHGASRFRSCLGLMFWPSCPSLGEARHSYPHIGDLHPISSRPCQAHTSAVQARAGSPFCGVLGALRPPCLTANVGRHESVSR